MVLGLVLVTFIAFGQTPAHQFKQVEQQIKQAIRDQRIPSMAIAVAQNGKVIYRNAWGYANVNKKIKATIHTPYLLASVSKSMTATALMLLHQKGVVHLDVPITQYMAPLKLKRACKNFRTPTLREVMNHTSGLGTYFDISYADETYQVDDFKTAWQKYGRLFNQPGERFEYSNLGYGLLDYIIAKYAGQSYPNFMQKQVFSLLKMPDSFVENSSVPSIKSAQKYGKNLTLLPSLRSNTSGAGNIYSSITDLIRFGLFHLNTSTKNVQLYKEMQSYRNPHTFFDLYEKAFYGLGWYVQSNNQGQKVVWHEGGMMGTASMLKLFPQQKLAIAVITNTYDNAFCRQMTDALTKAILPDYSPSPIQEIAHYRAVGANTAWQGVWQGYMHITGKKIPVTLNIQAQKTTLSYPDYTFQSFLTNDQPLPYQTTLFLSMHNQQAFLGTGTGELPVASRRKEYRHILSLKLLRKKQQLSGTITMLAAAPREYYAYPFFIELEKK